LLSDVVYQIPSNHLPRRFLGEAPKTGCICGGMGVKNMSQYLLIKYHSSPSTLSRTLSSAKANIVLDTIVDEII
jgi:hypothetical protein